MKPRAFIRLVGQMLAATQTDKNNNSHKK